MCVLTEYFQEVILETSKTFWTGKTYNCSLREIRQGACSLEMVLPTSLLDVTC